MRLARIAVTGLSEIVDPTTAASQQAAAWIADRFAGKRAPNDGGRG